MDIFEQASRQKIRFDSVRGPLVVEDLWDLPLMARNSGFSLNDIAINLHQQLQTTTVSFVEEDKKPNPDIQLRFDIVKHVIDVKKTEQKALAEAQAKAEYKQKLLAKLAERKDAELDTKSAEELEAMINAL